MFPGSVRPRASYFSMQERRKLGFYAMIASLEHPSETFLYPLRRVVDGFRFGTAPGTGILAFKRGVKLGFYAKTASSATSPHTAIHPASIPTTPPRMYLSSSSPLATCAFLFHLTAHYRNVTCVAGECFGQQWHFYILLMAGVASMCYATIWTVMRRRQSACFFRPVPRLADPQQ